MGGCHIPQTVVMIIIALLLTRKQLYHGGAAEKEVEVLLAPRRAIRLHVTARDGRVGRQRGGPRVKCV